MFYVRVLQKKGNVVECLEMLCNGEESLRKSQPGFCHHSDDCKNSLRQQEANGYVFYSNQSRIKERKEKDGLCLSSALSKI